MHKSDKMAPLAETCGVDVADFMQAAGYDDVITWLLPLDEEDRKRVRSAWDALTRIWRDDSLHGTDPEPLVEEIKRLFDSLPLSGPLSDQEAEIQNSKIETFAYLATEND